jgi:hypothetical protein
VSQPLSHGNAAKLYDHQPQGISPWGSVSPAQPHTPTRPMNRRHGRDQGRVEGAKTKNAAKVSNSMGLLGSQGLSGQAGVPHFAADRHFSTSARVSMVLRQAGLILFT